MALCEDGCGRLSLECSPATQTCTCVEVFGLTGQHCNQPSTASRGSAAFVGSALAVVLVLVMYHLRTLFNLVSTKPLVFKLNLAFRMFASSWLGLALTLISLIVATMAPFRDTLVFVLAFDFAAVLFQMAGLSSLVVGFYRIAMMRTMNRLSPFSEKSAFIIMMCTGVLIALLLTVSYTIACFVMAGFFLFATVVAGISPVLLFYRAMKTKREFSAFTIISAAISEAFLCNGAVLFLLLNDESRASLSRQNSREFATNDPENRKSTGIMRAGSILDIRFSRQGSFILANDIFSAENARSTLSVLQANQDRQAKKAEFFTRSLVAGRNLFLTGVLTVVFWFLFAGYAIDYSVARDNKPLTIPAVFWALRSLFLGLSCHSLLGFSSHVYKKAARENQMKDGNGRESRPGSMELNSPRAMVSWIRESSDFTNKRPLSVRNADDIRPNSTARDMSRDGSHTSMSAIGKRLVDEVINRGESSGGSISRAGSKDESPQKQGRSPHPPNPASLKVVAKSIGGSAATDGFWSKDISGVIMVDDVDDVDSVA